MKACIAAFIEKLTAAVSEDDVDQSVAESKTSVLEVPRSRRGGFAAICQLSDALTAFLGCHICARTEVLSQLQLTNSSIY